MHALEHCRTREQHLHRSRMINETVSLEALGRELTLLRKAVLRQGHAQELFQARVEEAVGRLAAPADTPETPERAGPPPPALSSTQVRVLLELDQAILQLLRLAAGNGREATAGRTGLEEPAEDAPRSLHEGLSFLQIRVRNLQHALGLEVLPTQNRPFDDRWHEVCGVAHRPDLPDGQVVKEILPGYRLGERVVRPARVIVNRHHS